MYTHETYSHLLPIYAAGHLDSEQRRTLESHLQECADCREDLALWRAVGAEISAANQNIAAPHVENLRIFSSKPGLIPTESIRKRAHKKKPATPAQRAWQLLWAQVPLVQREMWPAAALVMLIGFVITLLVDKTAVLRILAPLVTAACLAVIHGPEHDPAAELTASTTTSPWKILLARVTLVFGYNLLLALAVSLFVLVFIPAESLGGLILGWLAPMTFLSTLALLLSQWVGTTNALMLAYLGWLAQFIPFFMRPVAMPGWLTAATDGYTQIWQSPATLLSAALLLFAAALWSANAPEHSLHRQR
ncbi:MAG: anti-sigma factor family protein [Chloroflexota bacterium]